MEISRKKGECTYVATSSTNAILHNSFTTKENQQRKKPVRRKQQQQQKPGSNVLNW